MKNVICTLTLQRISQLTAVLILACSTTHVCGQTSEGMESFLLSENGSGRATGYGETNKIITYDHKTHVVWIDSISTTDSTFSNGFRVQARTLDRKTNQWSETYTLGGARDNHGGPALTVDSQGYLHAVYYPHHNAFRYRKSKHPNDTSEWEDEISFGSKNTYPTLMVGPDDTLYLTARRSVSSKWTVDMYEKKSGKDWSDPWTIMKSLNGDYSNFQEGLAWGPDHKTLHMSMRYLNESKDSNGNKVSPLTVGYMRSDDFGRTWRRSDGTEISGVATPSTVTQIEQTAPPGGTANLRCRSIAVAPDGTPYVLYNMRSEVQGQINIEAWLASPDAANPSGPWLKRLLPSIVHGLSEELRPFQAGGLVIGDECRMYSVMTMVNAVDRSWWGHPTSEIIWLESNDGGQTFEATLVSKIDPKAPNWLPNIERPTGFNTVRVPSLIYQSGIAGNNNDQQLSNKVFWVQVKPKRLP